MSQNGPNGTHSLSRLRFWRNRRLIGCRWWRRGTRRWVGWNLASLSRKNSTSPLIIIHIHRIQGTSSLSEPQLITLRSAVWVYNKWSFHRRKRACSISLTLVAVKDLRSDSPINDVVAASRTHGRAAWTFRIIWTTKDRKMKRSVCVVIPFSACTSLN